MHRFSIALILNVTYSKDMSNEYNDEILEQAWERVQNEHDEERLEQQLKLNDLEEIYNVYDD